MKNENKKWQNLYHSKCPNCDTKMEQKNGCLVCPNTLPEDRSKNCFFIRLETVVEFLLDEKHAANQYLKAGEREQLEETIQNLSNMA